MLFEGGLLHHYTVCPENEEWRECPSNCEPSCTNQSPICNLACLLKPQCQCKFGFYRGPGGKCVPVEQCKGADPTCENTSCDECKKYSKECVCEMVKPQGCVDGKPCKLFPRCIPKGSFNPQDSGNIHSYPMFISERSCSASPCPSGKRCELREVACFAAPW
ncbi:trypsin Inhibitor like cysteine rich domain protein [Ancylostoma duodenale]|uniref:Trypsin Inhibitor like cysteine rich domain protein n=1 Tax=Ancylostoma duodenale TaxID=51022 RepID=A0A0C2CMX8_9BILA|nr:trypsin Inhibitor like cysteine rich domain protein [Ancylostoma duodenale]